MAITNFSFENLRLIIKFPQLYSLLQVNGVRIQRDRDCTREDRLKWLNSVGEFPLCKSCTDARLIESKYQCVEGLIVWCLVCLGKNI